MIRVLANGLRIQLMLMSRSAYDLLEGLMWPVVYATIAFYLFGAHGDPRRLFAASLGATVMAMWAFVTTTAGGAIQQQRRLGTLELLVAAPTPLLCMLAPASIGSAAIGVYALAATLFWGRLVYGIPLHLVHPALFVLSLPVAVIAIGMLGLILQTAYVSYRAAGFLGNSFTYPGWLVTGLLVPISLLPVWVRPISWVMAPTWGIRALRAAALGGHVWPNIGVCLGLSCAYGAAAAVGVDAFSRLARKRATLALT